MSTDEVRGGLLLSLLELDRPLGDIQRALSAVAWDSEEELATLQPAHVTAILRRFTSGILDAESVQEWAEAIEGRDDIGFESESHDILKEAIFDLANPVLQGSLNIDLAERWINRLLRRR